MKGETTIALVKELENINSVSSRNSYIGSWCEFIFSIVWLASLYKFSFEKIPDKGLSWLLWFPTLMFLIALILFFHSIYLIIRHITNKKFAVIIEALLESNKND
jgi:hypothetical protein